MAVSYSLASLKTAIKNHAEDQGTTFAANLDNLIQMAESELLKALPLDIFKNTVDDIVFTQGISTVTKPTGYVACDSFTYTVSGTRYTILPRTYDYVVDYAPVSTDEGLPKYYAELDETDLLIGPSPNAAVAAVSGVMRFTKNPGSLVTVTAGTWFSQNAGELLFAACMKNADRFGVADERIPVWKAEFDRLLGLAYNQFRHLLSRSYSPLAAQPEVKGER